MKKFFVIAKEFIKYIKWIQKEKIKKSEKSFIISNKNKKESSLKPLKNGI
jgi:hypothetical protein